MGRISAVSALILLSLPAAVQAQAAYADAPVISGEEIALGYNYLRSNAPPGGDPKFNAEGAFASVGINFKYWLGAVAEVSRTHADDISLLGQNLTLLSYAGGPRLMFHTRRTMVFMQGLVGAAHGSDSYFPTSTGYTTSANSLAYSAGGGLDYGLSPRWALRGQGQYLHTALPNGINNSEHHLSIGVGLVYRFHIRSVMPEGRKFARLHSADVPVPAPTQPQQPAPVPESAALPSSPGPVAAPISSPEDSSFNRDFHQNVQDIFFDYDSSALLPETQPAIARAADYLKAHPEVQVLIGGYSDERGTIDYNLALGNKRAAATRDALIAGGVDPSRISIVSYGKSVQVCTQGDEACWKQNRRAAFMIHP